MEKGTFWEQAKIIAIVILLLACMYLWTNQGKYKSTFIDRLAQDNVQLRQLAINTVRLAQQSNNKQLIQALNKIGYNIPEPKVE